MKRVHYLVASSPDLDEGNAIDSLSVDVICSHAGFPQKVVNSYVRSAFLPLVSYMYTTKLKLKMVSPRNICIIVMFKRNLLVSALLLCFLLAALVLTCW